MDNPTVVGRRQEAEACKLVDFLKKRHGEALGRVRTLMKDVNSETEACKVVARKASLDMEKTRACIEQVQRSKMPKLIR